MAEKDHAVGLREGFRRVRKIAAGLGLAGRAARLPVGNTPHRVLHRENKLRVLRYDTGVAPRFPLPVLMVPSLINRHYIFDLLPGKSIAETLANQGFAVSTIDWGAPGDEDRYLSLERYLGSYLHRAVRAVCQDAGSEQLVLLGYCLGGTLAASYLTVRPERVHSFIALTTPVDFTDSGLLGLWAQANSFDLDTLIEAEGNVPWTLLQSSFQLLRPTLPVTKVKGILQRFWDDEFLDGVLALETWGNDNVSFAGACYRDVIDAYYRKNALIRGGLSIGGQPVDLGAITCPLLNVQASVDNIVPAPASQALSTRVASTDVTTWTVPGGHIGAVVSRKAMQKVWPAVSAWILERS